MIFIVLLFHTNSAFSIADIEIQPIRTTQVTQHHWPIFLLTNHCSRYDDIISHTLERHSGHKTLNVEAVEVTDCIEID